ncbi:hypothetical protein CK203_014771 [Vitis vinifera]|uniref:BED-type domain-containing protein n=1 Tax=Vitis vinifera TaxID=29760 RepID=A0A438JGI5_VITVI|nr:hypothetical protein CK203_014771 [Vitis vinifera]
MESNLTSSSGQDSITNSQSTRSKTNLAWEHVSEERYANRRKALICLYCKKITKYGDIHRMKQHLAGVKEDIGPWDMAEGEEEVQEMQSPMDAKKEVQLLVDSYRAIWAKVGCTIMSDGWTDNRQRTLINFLVYCPEGISFVKSVDASDIVKDATNLFQLFDEVIEWVGPLNVVHIVTDNATNYVATGRLISQKHKHINWSPCAAHCLNLIFKDIGKMDHVAELDSYALALMQIGNLRIGSSRWGCNYGDACFPNRCLPKAISSSFQLQIVHGLKRWILDFLSFETKVLKGKLETMNEMKLFRDRLRSFGRDLAYSSREVLQPVDDDQPVELDVEELENLLYEEWSIPINEVEGSSSHIDDEDGGDVAIEGLDVENFGFPDAHVQYPYSNFQNE